MFRLTWAPLFRLICLHPTLLTLFQRQLLLFLCLLLGATATALFSPSQHVAGLKVLKEYSFSVFFFFFFYPPLAVPGGKEAEKEGGGSARSKHRRTLSDTNTSNSQVFNVPKDAVSPRRGSQRHNRVVENTGPLQQDTRQQELVEKTVSGSKMTGLFTLRGRTPRSQRKLESDDASESSTSFGGDTSLDQKRSNKRPPTSLFARSSGR
jgi:hypothetical protein